MDSIDYRQEIGFYLNGRKCDFTKDVMDSFPHRDAIDLCHGISFHCMAQGLVNAMNFYNFYIRSSEHDCSETQRMTLRFITGMIISVKRMKMNEQEIHDFVLNGIMSDTGNLLDDYRPHLRGLIYSMELLDRTHQDAEWVQQGAEWVIETHMHHCTYYVNHILDLLYNEKTNLDYGYSVWNRSLQDAFDASSYTYDGGSGRFVLTNEQDCIAVTNLLKYTMGKADGLEQITDNALFFYMTVIGENAMLYSSRNDPGLFQPATAVGPCSVQIAYHDYLTNQLTDIPMV